ncbi:uncharacterized protein LOC143039669 [Oratosquilla oratoria]|uniref:uncharacterized protein LOC143039669 n=1 Tax=Oratosquilla oratoria TaxID=337810 RepID=UPI003F765BCB
MEENIMLCYSKQASWNSWHSDDLPQPETQEPPTEGLTDGVQREQHIGDSATAFLWRTSVQELVMQSPSSELLEVPHFMNEVTLVDLPMEEVEQVIEEPCYDDLAVREKDRIVTSHDHCYGNVFDTVDGNSSVVNNAVQEVSPGNDAVQHSSSGNESSLGTGMLEGSTKGNRALQDSSEENKAFQDSSEGNSMLQDTGNAVRDSNLLGNDTLQESSSTVNDIVQDSSTAKEDMVEDDNLERNYMIDSNTAEKEMMEDNSLERDMQDSSAAEKDMIEDDTLERNYMHDRSTAEKDMIEDDTIERIDVHNRSKTEKDMMEDDTMERNEIQDSSMVEKDVIEDATVERNEIQDSSMAEKDMMEDDTMERNEIQDSSMAEKDVTKDATMERNEIQDSSMAEKDVTKDATMERNEIQDSSMAEKDMMEGDTTERDCTEDSSMAKENTVEYDLLERNDIEDGSTAEENMMEDDTMEKEMQDSSTAKEDTMEDDTMEKEMQDSSTAKENTMEDDTTQKEMQGSSTTKNDDVEGKDLERNGVQDGSTAENDKMESDDLERDMQDSNTAVKDMMESNDSEGSSTSKKDTVKGDNLEKNCKEDSGMGKNDTSKRNGTKKSSSLGDVMQKRRSLAGNREIGDRRVTRSDVMEECSSSTNDSALQSKDHVSQHCSVKGCKSVQKDSGNLAFHDLPSEPERRRAWLSALNITSGSARVCGKHFVSGKASDDPQSPDYTPSRFINGSQCKEDHVLSKCKPSLHGKSKVENIRKLKTGHIDKSRRKGRIKIKRTTCSRQKIAAWRKLKAWTSELKEMDADTGISDSTLGNKESTKENRLILINTLIQSKTFAKQSLELDSLKDKDQKVEVLTGFNGYAVMASVFNIVRSHITNKTPLSNFDQFMVFCMRLRLNLSIDHLASIFNAPPVTICHAFNDVLEVMNKRIVDGLLLWPDKDIAKLTVPTLFQELFGKSPYFIECRDILIEKPDSAFSQKQTYSKNKCHYSMKYFLCLTSQGTVCFLSKGWGGGTSDKYVTENCGFLQKLMPGDVVLSNPHFNNQEVINIQGEGVKIPAYTKGRHKLLPLNIGKSHTNSSLQERVKQMLGLTRLRYLMLESVMPISFLMAVGEEYTKLDKLMRIVCALTNLCSLIES